MHERLHFLEASGLSVFSGNILHFFGIALQVVELVFFKESWAIGSSDSDAETSDVGHGFGQVLRRGFLDRGDLFLGVANGDVGPVFGDGCSCGSHLEIKMIPPIRRGCVFKKWCETLAVDSV